ncbi:MAG TPA: chemotaxis protein CheW [Gemmatimonadaceae bacterium]
MTKKRKISYSDFAPSGAKSEDAPAPKAAEQPKRVAKRAPKAPEPAPEVQPKPRVSSPVEIASLLRASGPHALPEETATAEQPPTPRRPDSPVTAPTPDPRPLTPSIDAEASVEDYATALARRLAAMAPAEIDEAEQNDRDERPLRERVRSAEGVADLLMFRIGPEIFATELAAVEEAVSLPEIHHLPEMPAAMLGAFNLRGRLTPVYSPAHVIGVPLAGAAQAALLVSANGRRLGLAVDDVEDVFQVDLSSIREAPGIDAADGILLGVAHYGQELVAVLDAEALVAACLTGHVMETA